MSQVHLTAMPTEGWRWNRLRLLRAERGWSQGELAQRLGGISRQAINAIETGKHDPSLELAFRLARLFDLKVDELFDPAREVEK